MRRQSHCRSGRSRPGRSARLFCLLVVGSILGMPGISGAQEPSPESGGDRWLPGIAAVGGLMVQEVEASVDSTARGKFDGDTRLIYPYVGFNAELMMPSLRFVPGDPRLFVQAGAAATFDVERNAVKEGTAGRVTIPIVDANNDGIPDPGRNPPLAAVTGTGSAVRSQVQPLLLSAAAGIAFETAIGERTLWIKPSVVYRMESTEVTTVVSAAESINDDGLCPCRTLEFSDSETGISHALGPGLELEIDTARAGPFMLTLFMSAQGYRVLSDPEIALDAVTAFDDGKPAAVSSTFTRNPWSYGANVGLRFRWLPE